MKASDLFKSRPFWNLLLQGDSGSGKTWWSAQSPMSFHLLVEPQGLESIAASNPDAHVSLMDSYTDFIEVFNDIKKGSEVKTKDGQPAYRFKHKGETITTQTLVLDSLTEIQEQMVKHYQGTRKKMEIQDWGFVQRDTKALLGDLRSLPVNVVAITLLKEIRDEEDHIIAMQPDLYGKASHFAPRYFSSAGVAKKRTTQSGSEYGIYFNLSSKYTTKMPPNTGFPGVIKSDAEVPGKTSLGSVSLFLFPGVNVPHRPGDSADFVKGS